MKRFIKVFSLTLVLLLSVFVLAACDQIASLTQNLQTTTDGGQNGTTTTTAMNKEDAVDYVSKLKLDMNSSSLKVEVTVKS